MEDFDQSQAFQTRPEVKNGVARDEAAAYT